ncbi:hypothetical protein DLM_4295 [Aquitalea magnusonii]|uniref:Uncharacterized protein n=1 Tax=Aquitalea magnusonii TaxID=332411 RepID=A0A3G9GW74_9NEIS|nr:hypothetical protein DLM_4295 [Aquitalea magnusonii]
MRICSHVSSSSTWRAGAHPDCGSAAGHLPAGHALLSLDNTY